MNCLEMISEFHVGQVLYKMPVPQGANKLKQMHITKTGRTCRRASSLHCTFLKKYRIVVSQSPVPGIQIRSLNAGSG